MLDTKTPDLFDSPPPPAKPPGPPTGADGEGNVPLA
jgi:hypothetical protein